MSFAEKGYHRWVSIKRVIFFPNFVILDSLSANPTKWSNTLKQFVGNLPTNSLSVFDHFVKFALKGFSRGWGDLILLHNIRMGWKWPFKTITGRSKKRQTEPYVTVESPLYTRMHNRKWVYYGLKPWHIQTLTDIHNRLNMKQQNFFRRHSLYNPQIILFLWRGLPRTALKDSDLLQALSIIYRWKVIMFLWL